MNSFLHIRKLNVTTLLSPGVHAFPTLPNELSLHCSEVQIHWRSSNVGHLGAIQVQALVGFFHPRGRVVKNIIGPNPTYKNC